MSSTDLNCAVPSRAPRHAAPVAEGGVEDQEGDDAAPAVVGPSFELKEAVGHVGREPPDRQALLDKLGPEVLAGQVLGVFQGEVAVRQNEPP